jgi:two-component system nitrogen regulation response regulator GlnG
VRYLTEQPWLGNVRELRNALEHAVIIARGGPLLPEHFPSPTTLAAAPADPARRLADAVRSWLEDRVCGAAPNPPADLYAELLRQVEPPLLDEVMRRLQGNRFVAAQWLGLNRATVRKKLGLYGLADTARGGEADDAENDEEK